MRLDVNDRWYQFKPWWAVHLFNAVFSTLFLALALWFGNLYLSTAMGAFWGAANLNGLGACMIRREMAAMDMPIDNLPNGFFR
jgi:hypothetical protein